MPHSVYLINPATDYPNYYGAEIFAHLGLPPAAFVADLAVTTVAALAPPDLSVSLCDENISAADLEHPAGIVGITGKTSQRLRMLELAREFRRRGKVVVVGGPYASLSPAEVRPWCDVLVHGELESVAEELFTDLRSGAYRADYHGSRVELSRSPSPRWDLYPNHRALQGCLQTSRGCPFICEFCDTIAYVGRRQRHKPVERVLAELEDLYRLGYRNVFLADDNFTAHRPRAFEILRALDDFNQQATAGPVRFSTQISVDAGARPDLLTACSSAGLMEAFVGIETPNPDSLMESGKRQNLSADLAERVRSFVSHGIGVIGGLMVGFDADAPDIFRRQYEFAMATAVPTFSVNALNAPPSTPLYERLEREGRLLGPDAAGGAVTPWWTNMQPRQMTVEELRNGIGWLVSRLYAPRAFEQRMETFIREFEEPRAWHRVPGVPQREVNLQGVTVVRAVARLGAEEARMMKRLAASARRKPQTQRHLFANLFRYLQTRTLYQRGGFWDPDPDRLSGFRG